jgi:hypothetical protein
VSGHVCLLCDREARGFQFNDPNRKNAPILHFCSIECSDHHYRALKAGAPDRLDRATATMEAAGGLGRGLHAGPGVDVRALTRAAIQPFLVRALIDYSTLLRRQIGLPPSAEDATRHEADATWQGWCAGVAGLSEINQPILTALTYPQWSTFAHRLIGGYRTHMDSVAAQPPF